MANKYGRLGLKGFINKNFDDLNPSKLNAKELTEYSKIIQQRKKEQAKKARSDKAKETAKNNLRIRGRFISKQQAEELRQKLVSVGFKGSDKDMAILLNELNAEDFKRIAYWLKKTDIKKTLDVRQILKLKNKPILFTINSLAMSERLNEHIGKIEIDGKFLTKSEAIDYFVLANNANIQSELESEENVYLLIYDVAYSPETHILSIDTKSYEVITSNPDKPKNKNGKKAKVRRKTKKK